MSDVVLPASLQRLRQLDPALADSLAEDFARLSRAGAAVAWAQGQLPALLAARGERALLAQVVAAARELTRAPHAWALTWTGNLATGRASFRALAGDGAMLEAPPAVSRTMLGQVAGSGAPAWSDDASQDARFQAAESVRAMALRSVGCVPLGAAGVLWLEDPDEPGRFSPPDRMKITALCALAGRVLAATRGEAPTRPAAPRSEPVVGLVGDTPAMHELYAAIRAFAPMPWPTLVLGETGTGKEAVARALHTLSPRADAPFVPVNCGAIVETLAESTLFGHERGAFTGADRRTDGLLARVDGGTLFLDEVGELSPALQVKLLRLLQEGTYERVGGSQRLRFTGRVVAATHRRLDEDSGRGHFREDLYYRLAAGVIRVPPLREHLADVPDIASHLLARAADDLSLPAAPELGDDALTDLAARTWPGNVRQLENELRGALARALARKDRVVRTVDFSPAQSSPPAPSAEHPASPPAARTTLEIPTDLDLKRATAAFQQARIQAALEASGGNRSAAARKLGVSRQWLHRLLARPEGQES